MRVRMSGEKPSDSTHILTLSLFPATKLQGPPLLPCVSLEEPSTCLVHGCLTGGAVRVCDLVHGVLSRKTSPWEGKTVHVDAFCVFVLSLRFVVPFSVENFLEEEGV